MRIGEGENRYECASEEITNNTLNLIISSFDNLQALLSPQKRKLFKGGEGLHVE
jgi:hypothetical protein